MRARNIKPGFFTNEQLAECCFAARILFEGLWCLADRNGRLEDRPKRLKASVFPYDNIDADELLRELQEQDLIVRYENSGKRYIWIPKFLAHQKPHKREVASVIPPCELELEYMSKGLIKPELDEPEPHQGGVYDTPQSEHSAAKTQPRHGLGTNKAQPRQGRDALNEECGILNEESLNADSGLLNVDVLNAEKEHKGVTSANPVPTLPPDGGDAPSERFDLSAEAVPRPPRDDCPHQKIIELYHEILPELPHVHSWGDKNRANLRARWRGSRERQNLDWWRDFFQYVGQSDFLMGRTTGRDGKPFFANLGWLVISQNFDKVLNGNYNHGALDVFQQAAVSGYRGTRQNGGAPPDWGALRDEADFIDIEAQESEV